MRRRHTVVAKGSSYNSGGRWTLFPSRTPEVKKEDRLMEWAVLLLRRYGVMFRDLLTRETVAPAWWELAPVYRRMEARGEIRGGRFVGGVAGEQYAMPEAVVAVRRRQSENAPARRSLGAGGWLVISAADPLNLAGTI